MSSLAPERTRLPDRVARPDAATAAWLLALPCAAVTVALVLWLGPPLSRVLYPATPPFTILPDVGTHPEPVEETRYLVALLGPVLLAAGVALAAPRLRLPRRAGIAAALAAQLVGIAVVIACFVKQEEPGWQFGFFTVAQFAAGAVLAVALWLAARRGWLTGRRSETRALRILVPAVALLATAIWFLWFLNTVETVSRYGDSYNTAFQLDETFAVLNGLTPLVNHTAAYGSLWPFALAPLMALLGKTLFVWSVLMWALSVGILLAIYAVLRRVTRSLLGTLALYLPFMVFTFYAASRDLQHPIAIYQQVPLRDAGPFIVAWLVARRLDRARGATWPLFLAAGLAALNNADFGLAALGATVAALLWAGYPLAASALRRLAGSVALGLAAAFALVSVVTLARAGALPNPVKAIAVARIYSVGGIGVWRLPHVIGLPLVVYLTYAAAISVASVRAVRRDPDRLLTGMLAWSGIFGFGSAAYYVGASVPMGIPTLFPAWGFALVLLTVAAVRHAASARERLPAVPVLAAFFGFALILTVAARPPLKLAPWSQVQRLTTTPPTAVPPEYPPLAAPRDPAFRRFVAAVPDGSGRFAMRPGAPVALFSATGHLLADAYGLKDVVPYTGESVFTAEQFEEALRRLRAAGGSTVLMPSAILSRVRDLLAGHGFLVLTSTGYRPAPPGSPLPRNVVTVRSELTKWVDARALHPGGPTG